MAAADGRMRNGRAGVALVSRGPGATNAMIALHTAYLWALFTGALTPTELMFLALAAYVTYVVNAGQFLWKLRMARLDAEAEAIEENRTMAEVIA